MHVMNTKRLYQIKDVARLAGVSVRTLHHYDDIGLLSPSQRSAAGYRLYSHEDLLRLQQILIQRELGLPLEAIKRSLDDPEFDRCAALKQQRQEITARLERIQAMLQAIDTALGALAQGEDGMESLGNEVQSLFGGFDPSQYEEESEKTLGRERGMEGITTTYAALQHGRLETLRGGSGRALARSSTAVSIRHDSRFRTCQGTRRAASSFDRALVLSLLTNDACKARGPVRIRCALHVEHR